jgi:nucleoside-diphosphate-sugar epimerase
MLGWQPRTSLEDGLRSELDWVRVQTGVRARKVAVASA